MDEVTISASEVKALREKTGAGMMDSKKALAEARGDFEAAVVLLRKRGLSAAAKKASRIAAEGLAAINVIGSIGILVEMNAETDFVARNEQFQNLVRNISHLAITVKDLEELKILKMPSGRLVSEEILENIATIGENLTLRRMATLEVSEGVIGMYVHNCVADQLGKIAVLVGLESKAADKARLQALANQLAIHIAGINPQSVDESDLDPNLVEQERKIFFEQSKAAGKSDEIINKMVDDRVRKFLSEIVLLQQNFLFNPKIQVAKLLEDTAKELGTTVKITKFIRYEVGEGIAQREKNFAEEVAAITQG